MLRFVVTALLIEITVAQYPLQTYSSKSPIDIATSSIIEALKGRVSSQIPVPVTPLENIIMCRNLAEQIEYASLAKLKRNAMRRPVFGQIAGPLIEELAKICRCPVCTTNNYVPSNAALPLNVPAISNNLNTLYVNPSSAQNPNLNMLKFF
ncbi:hypothetical protein RR48_10117 [Papilio machaon]|uniref:Uncharacterized protein n=1 Tax=Papilio machaon TaxID=76193 RepID=A0A194QZQ6_PAPMA|nr:hypothetical protein RR48_10117 [Papilio machaon]